MAKYNKSQVQYILGKLKKGCVGEYPLREELRKKYTPPPPKAYLAYKEKVVEAEERARKEASEIATKQREYISKVEDTLVLADVDFDLEKAFRELKSIK